MDEKMNEIITAFRKQGGRVTGQRKALIELILANPGCTCKELYYLARSSAGGIGRATVYRTVHSLEELGFLNKRVLSIA